VRFAVCIKNKGYEVSRLKRGNYIAWSPTKRRKPTAISASSMRVERTMAMQLAASSPSTCRSPWRKRSCGLLPDQRLSARMACLA